jgi:hypothetical protein
MHIYIHIFILKIIYIYTYIFIINKQNLKNMQKVELMVNELDSLDTLLPFSYYFLKYCPPSDLRPANENLGSKILGETTQSSPYEVSIYN